jgi:hypothetical protein
MQFNQVNKNLGDVNNAISGKGTVVQTTGTSKSGHVTSGTSETGNVVQTGGSGNRVETDQRKEVFWGMLWKRVKGCWKWIMG